MLALMLLAEARRTARVSTRGELVALDEQDRGAWDAALVDEGHLLVRVEGREEPRPRSVEEARDDILETFTADHAADARQVIQTEVLREIHAELHPERLVRPRAEPSR